METNQRAGWTAGSLKMAAAMIISGTVGWFVLATALPALTVVFWRCAFGAIAMAMVCATQGLLHRGMLSRRQFYRIILGGITLTLNWICLFAAYAQTSIAVATVTYHVQPFILVGLGAVLFHETLTLHKLGWMMIAFFGVTMMMLGGQHVEQDSGQYLYGIGLALAAAIFYAITAAITKTLRDVSPCLLVFIQLGVGSVILLPFASLPVVAPSDWPVWGLLFVIGFVHTGLMSALLYSAVQTIPTTLVGGLAFIYPIVAIAVDAWVLGNPLNIWQLAGTLIILTSVAGMNTQWRFFSRQHQH